MLELAGPARRRGILATSLGLAVLLGVASGCGRASSPVEPPPPPAPNPGNAEYACFSWYPKMPTVEEAVFDLDVLGRDAALAIRDAGGTILHEYQVPVVRARLRVSAIPMLVGAGSVSRAREVEEDRPLEFDGIVGIPTPLSDADREFFASLGVTKIFENPFSNPWFQATIPDAAVPAIRSRPAVTMVEIERVACLAGAGGP